MRSFLYLVFTKILQSKSFRRAFEKEIKSLVQSWAKESYHYNNHCVSLAIFSAVSNFVPGDYLEFGVREGNSFLLAHKRYRELRREMIVDVRVAEESLPNPMRFFAFDAFDEGFPTPCGKDDSQLRPPHWREGSMVAPASLFIERCNKQGLRNDDLIVIPGYFERSLSNEVRIKHKMRRAAVIHLDCDLYESTITALDFSTPLIALGTVIVFDDYNRYRGSIDHGQFKAFAEWQEKNMHLKFRQLNTYGENAVSFICCSGPETED